MVVPGSINENPEFYGGICSHSPTLAIFIGTETSCNENFQTGFVVAGVGFLSYWNHQLIKFEED